MTLSAVYRVLSLSTFTVLAVGCTQNPAYTLSETNAPSAMAYTGAAFASQPAFTISPNAGTASTQGDNFALTPYFDAACSTPADGAVAAFHNPASLVNGTATFVGLNYTPPVHTEETVYLKVKGQVTGLTYCTSSVLVLQHFNVGIGSAIFGVTGAAGNTGATENDIVKASVLDSQGRTLIAGSSLNLNNGYQAALWRYFPDGTLDTNFGAGLGYVVTSATGAAGAVGAAEIDSANAVQIDSQGRIVLVGTSANAAGGIELAIWRYNADGSIDTTLGAGTGFVVSGATGAAGATVGSEKETVSALQLDTLGNIVVVGSSKNAGNGTELAIWRYTPAGALDTTFATVGYLHSGTSGIAGAGGALETETANAFQIDTSGNLVIAGSSKNGGGGTELALWRYVTAGTLDATFGTAGHVIFGTTGAAGASGGAENDAGNAIKIDSQSRLVIAGNSKNVGSGVELALWRYSAAGVLDATFGTAGNVISGTTGVAGAITNAENDVGNGLQIDASGNLVVAGASENTSGGTQSVIWRYLPAGTLDTSFASVGYALFGTTGAAGGTVAGEYDASVSLLIDANQRLIVSGVSKNSSGGQELSVSRYLSSGSLDI